ncbi:MAG TPA: hypothetical protein VHB77_05330 [Planctomycetaceae bacterium]|nr:hypothetical protein [Planctomycetaceae bacterium]
MGLSGITGGATSVGLGSLFKASTTLPGSGLFSQVLQGAQSTTTPATATPSIVVPPGASDPTANTLNFGALPGGNLLRAGPNGFSAARIEQLRQQTLAAKQTFLKLMNQKLREAGIDPSVAINLQTDSSGNVAVTNDHPDKAMIEALFGEDPDLQQSLEQLSKSATALRDAQQPQAAGTGDQTLNLTLRGTDVEIAFA